MSEERQFRHALDDVIVPILDVSLYGLVVLRWYGRNWTLWCNENAELCFDTSSCGESIK